MGITGGEFLGSLPQLVGANAEHSTTSCGFQQVENFSNTRIFLLPKKRPLPVFGPKQFASQPLKTPAKEALPERKPAPKMRQKRAKIGKGDHFSLFIPFLVKKEPFQTG